MSGGTVLLIALIVFVAWHFIPKGGVAKPKPRFRYEPRAVASDPDWQRFIKEHCESPAEEAFLEAIIEAYRLEPDNGSLKADAIKIDFQVEVGRYRLDFLANEWLIIEIDGAAYHSSKEAKARDAARDRYFLEIGYAVVRIPAKVVFNDPGEAIQRVRTALQSGKPVIAEPERQSGFERLQRTFAASGAMLEHVNSQVTLQNALAEALHSPRLAFETEKKLVDSAISEAERKIKTDEFCSDPEKKALYDANYNRIGELLKKYQGEDDQATETDIVKVPSYAAPQMSGNDVIDREIERHFAMLNDERQRFFDEARERISQDQRIERGVLDKLVRLKRPEIWYHIS